MKAYETLEVERGASTASIKKQYRILAKKWHPDNWPHGSQEEQVANERMKKINESYELIKTAPLQYIKEIKRDNDIEWTYRKRSYDNISITIPREDVLDGVLRFLIGVAVGLVLVAPMKYSAYWFIDGGYPSSTFIYIPIACGALSYLFLGKISMVIRRVVSAWRRK